VTTRLLIARHGNTFGPGDVVTRVGRTDLPLVASGLEQGRKLGAYLKAQGMMPEALYTSRLQRTQQTAEQAQAAMGTSLKLQPLAMFDEIDYGPDENQPEEAVVARLGKAALAAWDEEAIVPKDWKVDPTAIRESWNHFAAEIAREHTGKTILVVTSNGIARFAPHITGDFESFRTQHALKISTGALCVFEHTECWRCTGWNIRP
jgi:2,3-bisphosphoglycerate-dependent phosphoglycerate mutase